MTTSKNHRSRTVRRLSTAAAFALLAAASARPAGAATPDLIVDSNSPGNSPYAITSNQSFGNVIVGNTGTGVVNHSAGTLGVSNGLVLSQQTGGVGTYNLSGTGVVNITGGGLNVGGIATSSFVQSGSSAVNASTVPLSLGHGSTYSLGGTATLSATLLRSLAVGNNFAQTGGTAVFGSVGIDNSGALNLSGGAFTSTGSLALGGGGYGTTTNNVVNQSGTSAVTAGKVVVGDVVNVGPLTKTGAGTYNLNGGTLTTGSITTTTSNGLFGVGTLNLNGGTIVASAASTAFISGVTTANVRNGGTSINTNGFNVTVPQALAHSNVAGDAATDGGLTKSGAGTLTLSGANTYTGPTQVNAGVLALTSTGTLANTASVTINAGGTLTLGAANQLNAAASLTLNAASGPGAGATVAFNTGGFSQTLGAVTLGSTSVVDLASGASLLRLGNSVANAWTGTLAIWNYTGTAITGNGTDELFFGTNTAGLTPAQLASIRFYSDGGTTALAAAGYASLTGGEVVPGGVFPATGVGAVPEPSTWALLGLGAAGLGLTLRQRRRAAVCA